MDTPLSFTKFYNYFPILPSQTPSISNTCTDILQNITAQIQKTDEQTNLVSHMFWKHLFSKFYQFHFNYDEKLELLQLVSKLIRVNFGQQTVKDQIQFCGQSGGHFHKLQNSLHFKHDQSLQYFNYMASKICHYDNKNELFFSDMKFDLSLEETEKVAAKVRNFCSNDLDSFAFLSLYLQISVTKKLNIEPLAKVQQDYQAQLQNLSKKYPPNKFQISTQTQASVLPKIRTFYRMERFFFQNNGYSHFDQLKKFVIKKAEDAKKDHSLFQKLVKDICYTKGYGFKSGVKIKSPDNQISIFRTIQKLIEQLLQQKQEQSSNSDNLSKSILKRRNPYKTYTNTQLKALIVSQKQSSLRKIQQILQSQTSIGFDSKDLLRGKCIFSTVQQIVDTVKKLSEYIFKSGHQIIEIKDRLNKNTNDAVLIIKLPNSIAQLQLVLKMDSISNQFNHKIYELQRSKLYTPITNLIIQNKKWSQIFFTDQYQIFSGIQKSIKSYKSQLATKFRKYKYDLEDFKTNFLYPYQISYQKDQKLQQQETNQIKNKVNILLQIIKQNQYVNINKIKRHQYQKVCEVKFLKDNIDFQRGLQLLYSIQSNSLKNNTFLLKLKGDILYQKGQLQQSLNCYFKSVETYQQNQKTQNQSLIYASVLNQIGLVYWNKGYYALSIQNFEKCLQIKTKIKGYDLADIASTLNNIGGVYDNKGDTSKALQNYEKCLAIKIKLKGNQSIDVATTFNNIGSVYDSRGDFNKALIYYEKCLDIKTKIKGKDSIDVATTLNNIGSVYDNKGDYLKALEYYERCLIIKRKVKGNESIDTATTLNNIGLVCQHKGDYALALQNYENCLNIQIKLKGQNSIDVATTLNNIGLVYTNNGNYSNALEYYQRCLQIQKHIKGQQCIDVATTLNNIGFVSWSKGDLDKALQHYQKCLKIQIKIKGQNSIDVATTLNNIGSAYSKKKDFQKALDNFQKCLRIQQQTLGRDSIDVALLLNNIGSVYECKGELKKALEYYQRCLQIKSKIKGTNSIDVATTLNNLSFLHEKMNCIQKSYECAKKSYEIRSQTLGEGHQFTKGTLRQLQKIQRLFNKINH